jgi:hypothetical protein
MIDVKNPHQLPRVQEIIAGKKFWGYLDTQAMQTRYVLAAHFLRDARSIVEVGGYRNNVITRFLTGSHDSVTVYSLDAEFETLELETLNGAPCRVRHIKDYFQNHPNPDNSLGVVALGLEIIGDMNPFFDLVRRSRLAVIEVPVDHAPSVEHLRLIRENIDLRLMYQVNLDLSPNEVIVQDELLKTNMNVPFWKRNMYFFARELHS